MDTWSGTRRTSPKNSSTHKRTFGSSPRFRGEARGEGAAKRSGDDGGSRARGGSWSRSPSGWGSTNAAKESAPVPTAGRGIGAGGVGVQDRPCGAFSLDMCAAEFGTSRGRRGEEKRRGGEEKRRREEKRRGEEKKKRKEERRTCSYSYSSACRVMLCVLYARCYMLYVHYVRAVYVLIYVCVLSFFLRFLSVRFLQERPQRAVASVFPRSQSEQEQGQGRGGRGGGRQPQRRGGLAADLV